MTIKTRYLIIALFLTLVGIFLLGRSCGRQRADNQSESIIEGLNDSIKVYQYQITELTKYAAEKDQLVLSQEQALEAELLEKKELKALHFKTVNEVTKLKAQVAILLDSIAHNGDIVIVRPCESDTLAIEFPAMRLPFNFGEKTNYYDFSGVFDTEGSMSVNLKVPMDVSIWTGYKKGNKNPVAIITTTNPYVTITDITSVKIVPRKPFYDKAWFRITSLVAAFGAGVYVASQ